MSTIINSFFCSISAFFFNNIFTFTLFCISCLLLYYLIFKRLNKVSKIFYFIFIALIFASGIVLLLLPNKEGAMSSIIVKSYYFGPVELFTIIILFISMLLSKYDDKVYNINAKVSNIEIANKKENKSANKKEKLKKKTTKKKENKKKVKSKNKE